jgi:hypothetical protein
MVFKYRRLKKKFKKYTKPKDKLPCTQPASPSDSDSTPRPSELLED